MSTIDGDGAGPQPLPAYDTDSLEAAERALVEGNLATEKAPPWKVLSWGLWDWGTQPFQTVITTFVFSVYLTSEAFGTTESTSLALSLSTGIAGLFIALLAPVLGQGSDRTGKRMFNLRWQTWVLAALSASLWFVAPEPGFLILGLVLLGVGNVVAEIANVNYYAAIDQVSTPKSVGKVSGLGWGMGYIGGIAILLLIVAIRGIDFDSDDVRFAMLMCGAWTAIFTIPIFLALRDQPRPEPVPRLGVRKAYGALFTTLRRIHRSSPDTIRFLIASALFRDGLAGVFTFGAILARGTFDFTYGEIIIFGIVANVAAGVSTMLFGLLDDRIGPKKVIMISLVALVVLGSAIFVLHDGGKQVFWVCGLAMTLFVGPAQSASRSFLARAIPAGKAGEIFGLYATTGRAVSFLAPLAFGGAILLGKLTGTGDAQYFGILGIVLVLLIGLAAMIPVKEKGHSFE
ncbi:MFS transporter [Tessaracoccus antarcticus]|uniref:MFS transporter n=1 Tax=Tessaracoccus antarcticus TaxID=2479848 RepID=UPI002680AB30|nr:MFS transporter [Tessaracoccus antarcticus]